MEYEDELVPDLQATRKDKDTARKDRTLGELMALMDDHSPIIPDAVTDYYLMRAGVETDNVALKRLLALATQKFVSDIATDAMQHAKLRQQATSSKVTREKVKDKRTVLTVEDLTAALSEHGVNVKKPEYYYEQN